MENTDKKYNRNGGLCECGCGLLTAVSKACKASVGLKKGEAFRFK
jgi:hypothetical protein